MKKLIPILLFTLIIPQIVFAAWWNPFSWSIFHRNRPVVEAPLVIEKNTEEIIKAKVDEQVNNILKEKADDEARILQQKTDDQKKIDVAVKKALDKQKIIDAESKVVLDKHTSQTQQQTPVAADNYFDRTVSKIEENLALYKDYELYLEKVRDTYVDGVDYLSRKSSTGTLEEHRLASIVLFNAEIKTMEMVILENKKSISKNATFLSSVQNFANPFVSKELFDDFQNQQSLNRDYIKKDIEATKALISKNLANDAEALQYH